MASYYEKDENKTKQCATCKHHLHLGCLPCVFCDETDGDILFKNDYPAIYRVLKEYYDNTQSLLKQEAEKKQRKHLPEKTMDDYFESLVDCADCYGLSVVLQNIKRDYKLKYKDNDGVFLNVRKVGAMNGNLYINGGCYLVRENFKKIKDLKLFFNEFFYTGDTGDKDE